MTGRPADPELADRVLRATLDLYREVGWAGFSLDRVARRARVGKAALYARWRSKDHLLAAALERNIPSVTALDTGDIRRDLLAIADAIVARMLDGSFLVDLRLATEEKLYPDLFGPALQALRREQSRLARQIVVHAVERGELPAGTSPGLVLDALYGVLERRYILTPAHRMQRLEPDMRRFAVEAVDFVLAAVTAG